MSFGTKSFLKLSFEVELMDNDDPSIDDINKMGNLPTYITKDIRKQPVKPLKILSTLNDQTISDHLEPPSSAIQLDQLCYEGNPELRSFYNSHDLDDVRMKSYDPHATDLFIINNSMKQMGDIRIKNNAFSKADESVAKIPLEPARICRFAVSTHQMRSYKNIPRSKYASLAASKVRPVGRPPGTLEKHQEDINRLEASAPYPNQKRDIKKAKEARNSFVHRQKKKGN